MFGMGMPEIIMILAIALIVIGPSKLPDLGRSLGRALREFRKATNEFKSSLNIDDDLGDVRRSFTAMNSDLKSSLTAAAFGDKKQTDSGDKAKSDAPAAPSPGNPAPPAAVQPSDTPEAETQHSSVDSSQERGDAGR